MNNILEKIIKKKLELFSKALIWRYDPTVIGITGSVGKTSAKEATATVLGHSETVRASSEGLDSDIAIPLAILGDYGQVDNFLSWFKIFIKAFVDLIVKSRDYPEFLVLEYRVEKPGDMKKLLSIVRPTIGVVTKLEEIPAHVEYFSGPEAVAREKSKLISQLPTTGFAVINADDPLAMEMREQTRAHVLTYGFSKEADVKVTSFETIFDEDKVGLSFKINYGGSFIPVRLDMALGESKAYASAAAASVGLVFSFNLVSISQSLELFKSPPGRLKVLEGVKNTKIIDDSYDSTVSSMEESLSVFKEIKTKKRKIVALGDTLEIGKYTLETHESFGKMVAKNFDILIAVGTRGKIIFDAAKKSKMKEGKIHHFIDSDEAGKFLQKTIKEGDLILIKGSRLLGMESIVKEIMAEPEKKDELLIK